MTPELYTFPDTTAGLTHALDTTRMLRAFGFRTRLAECMLSRFRVFTVVATPPPRPTRGERCPLNTR
jgi:hypothetical protein